MQPLVLFTFYFYVLEKWEIVYSSINKLFFFHTLNEIQTLYTI